MNLFRTMIFILSIVCFMQFSYAMPMRPVAPMNIEGTIQKLSWHAARKTKARIGMTGSGGQDRIIPAYYMITFSKTIVKPGKGAKGTLRYKSGSIIKIKIDHPKNDEFLKVGMRIRIIDFSMKGDEGGIRTFYKSLELVSADSKSP